MEISMKQHTNAGNKGNSQFENGSEGASSDQKLSNLAELLTSNLARLADETVKLLHETAADATGFEEMLLKQRVAIERIAEDISDNKRRISEKKLEVEALERLCDQREEEIKAKRKELESARAKVAELERTVIVLENANHRASSGKQFIL